MLELLRPAVYVKRIIAPHFWGNLYGEQEWNARRGQKLLSSLSCFSTRLAILYRSELHVTWVTPIPFCRSNCTVCAEKRPDRGFTKFDIDRWSQDVVKVRIVRKQCDTLPLMMLQWVTRLQVNECKLSCSDVILKQNGWIEAEVEHALCEQHFYARCHLIFCCSQCAKGIWREKSQIKLPNIHILLVN